MSLFYKVKAEEPETSAQPDTEEPAAPEEDETVEVEEPAVEEIEEEEEDPEDPQEIMNEEKTSECSKYKTELDTCTERVTSKSRTTETCEQELYDFLHCRDVKVAVSLFSKLK